MQNASFRRNVFLLLLLTVLAAPWAASAERPGSDRSAAGAASSPLELLGRFWTFLKSVWSETGCHIDPNGGCAPAPQTNEGCHIDPDGRCAPAAQQEAETGCHIDPSGGCRP